MLLAAAFCSLSSAIDLHTRLSRRQRQRVKTHLGDELKDRASVLATTRTR
ncbi:MAG TPA: hypothetical protein VIZ17_19335 [Acetobacteraceae bacterium]